MKNSIIVTLVLLAALFYCASASTQLGSLEPAKMKVISREGISPEAAKNINSGVTSRDVTRLANIQAIFGAAEKNDVNVTGINVTGDRWIEISNLGVASSDLTGWLLQNQENRTYTFPALVLDSGSRVKVHGGIGNDSRTDVYANTTMPLVAENADVITLKNATGAIMATYRFNASAQSETSTRSAEKLPILVTGEGFGDNKNPDTMPLLLSGTSTRDPEKQSILINDTSPRDPEKLPLLINISSSENATTVS